jgi:hypothetical protein
MASVVLTVNLPKNTEHELSHHLMLRQMPAKGNVDHRLPWSPAGLGRTDI